MITKNQQALLEYLGPEYSTKTIDMELCIYRKINARYDIEISGTARQNHPISVFVWDISHGDGVAAQIVERWFDIKNMSNLKQLLNNLVEKYQDLT